MIGNVTGRRLKTTEASLEILRLILEHDGLTLSELDGMVDSSKSSICSHLNTLLESRYLVKENGTYHVSFRVALLGERARHRYPTGGDIEAVIDRLAHTTEQEANFTIFEHGRLLACYGTSADENATETNARYRSEYHLHNTAAGKAILAELDRDEVESILDHWGLPRESEGTITNRDRLFDVLDEYESQGYALVDEEFAPGLVAIGAPVHDADGEIIGGVSVGGPKYRNSLTRLEREFAEPLSAAVSDIESAL
ncbi:ArcR family transcriptional regulator [Halorubrum saccharovorum]|uniref:ArcR family transcriptional regulator n=1 Tax=Halorubrum saccharovorum TaxID=2248 RepID=A0A081EVB1_9EURY|nr:MULTISPECIES: IclR family transcriptional regulator [Halorubrum]KDS91349.1 ArcR family transcriptional regulator [Halorubrum saccharovorum]